MLRRLLYNWFGWLQPLHVSYDNGAFYKPTVVLIHGIGSSAAMWQNVVTALEEYDIRLIGVDLLGFGKSPKPDYVVYSTRDHAKALRVTLRRRGVKKCIVVGHSLGSLVAIEFATLSPRHVHSLVLGSPPFYTTSDAKRWLPTKDGIYQALYRSMRKREARTLKLARFLGERLRPGRGFMLNEETLPAFIKTLEKSIEHQTSLEDAKRLNVPMTVIYGSLDPVILFKNIKNLEQANSNVTVERVIAGHEINQKYANALLQATVGHITEAYPKATPTK